MSRKPTADSVETRMTADSLRPTAYDLYVDETRIVEDPPKAKTPHEQESLQCRVAATDKTMDTVVCELHGLTEDEIRVVEGMNS